MHIKSLAGNCFWIHLHCGRLMQSFTKNMCINLYRLAYSEWSRAKTMQITIRKKNMLTERVWFNQTKQNKEKKTIENCFLCNHFLWCLFVLVFWTICKLILGSIAFYGINFFFAFSFKLFTVLLCVCDHVVWL